jgi:flagellar L-ring protein precursor FlgH
MIRGSRAAPVFIAWIAASLAGCSNPAGIGRAPALSPVGTGLLAPPSGPFESARAEVPPNLALNLPPAVGPSPINLYNDQRIARVGDIVTVIIAINDKATFGNSTDRSTTAKTGFSFDWAFNPATSSSTATTGTPLTFNSDVNSTSTSQGQGNIDRSEQIQLSVPAVVTHVFPNGNLLIRGSQEVQVNFELRQLTVAGIVHPADISRNNTIAYDRVAEARISYGGRGRLSEVQQPAWGQQIYDFLKPF